jgi:heavy metal sensor kinase
MKRKKVIIKTLRFRLTLFYALGVATLLIAFSFFSYFSLKEQMFKDHDLSLEKHINSYDLILKSKLYADTDKSPVIIPKKSITELADSIIDIISQEIYVHSIRNPKNNFIQVYSPMDTIIHESDNMGADNLPIDEGVLNRITYRTLDNFKNSQIRLGVYKSQNYTIAVGIPLKETISTLNNLFSIFSYVVPFILIMLVIGGWYLTQRSLKPIDDITKTAAEITSKHLHKRIKPSRHEDEIGRLIITLNDMIDRLEKSLEKIQQFSADASHELRTPLTILIGELQNALQKEMTTEDYQHVISNSIDEILVMSRIIDDLLTLYKADVNDVKLQMSNLNLNELLSEIYEDSQIISEKKHIKVSIELQEQISILGDIIRLRQLLLNLVENAIKYNVEYGEIKISLEREDVWALISITDTGIGIPPGNESKIFDRFYRIDKSRARSEGSTGLGLAISKWIVERHGGKIEFESEVNIGSRFKVYLPLTNPK